MIRELGHVVLKVRDLERSARFYRDVLGLKEVARYERQGDGKRRASPRQVARTETNLLNSQENVERRGLGSDRQEASKE